MKKKLVIAGAGIGGFYSYLFYKEHPELSQMFDVIVIDKNNHFVFTPLLTDIFSKSVNESDISINLNEFFKKENVPFINSTITKIDFKNNTVSTENSEIEFDYLILAIGGKTNFFENNNIRKNTLTFKKLIDVKTVKHVVNEKLKTQKHLKLTIVGGGATGIEVATQVSSYISNTYKIIPEITIIEGKDKILPLFDDKVRLIVEKQFSKFNIKLLLNSKVKNVTSTIVTLDNGKEIASDITIWVAGIKPFWPEMNGSFNLTPNQRIINTKYLNLERYKNIFLIGDNATTFDNNQQIPMFAQIALKQAKIVVQNIYNLERHLRLNSFKLEDSIEGYIIEIGSFKSVLQYKNFYLFGNFVWFLSKMMYAFKMPLIKNKINLAQKYIIAEYKYLKSQVLRLKKTIKEIN